MDGGGERGRGHQLLLLCFTLLCLALHVLALLCFAPLQAREKKNQGASVSVCAPQPLHWSRECAALRYTPPPSLPNSPIHLGGAFFSPQGPPRRPSPLPALAHSLLTLSPIPPPPPAPPTPNDHIALLFSRFSLFLFYFNGDYYFSLLYLSYTPSLAHFALRHEPLLSKSHPQHAMNLSSVVHIYTTASTSSDLLKNSNSLLHPNINILPASSSNHLYSSLLLRASPR